jgi:formylglycine-generating enzyme required for sulfatase activity
MYEVFIGACGTDYICDEVVTMDRRDILLGGLGLALSVASTPSSANTQQAGQKRFALILANQTYEKNPLPNIDNDAALMVRTLKSLGFTVVSLMNGTRSTMRTKLKELKENLTANPGGIAFVYYSGHGVQVDGENYLVPVNNASLTSEADVKEDCLTLSYVLEMSKGTRAKAYITVLDACRDNPFLGQKGDGNKGLAVVGRVLDASTLVAFAASPGETASATLGGANSIYTAELVKQLQTPNLSIQEVFQSTRSAVRTKSSNKQRPREDNGLEEQIFLNGRGAAVANPNSGVEAPAFPVARISAARFSTAASKLREKYPRLAEYVESLCVIPAGEFQMGGTLLINESPIHNVSLSSFGLAATPVTVGLWKEYAIARLSGVMPPEPNPSGFDGAKKFNIGWIDLDHPMVNVSWDDCRKFCVWASEVSGIALDLPSEAQWEYACRGGISSLEFPWGGPTDDVSVRNFLTANVWCSDAKLGDRGGTGSVNRTNRIWRNHPWGLVDMVGNVWEWCVDYYDPEWYSRPQASHVDVVNRTSGPSTTITYTNGATKTGPTRCIRGGSWDFHLTDVFRCALRFGIFAQDYNFNYGFRLSAGPG